MSTYNTLITGFGRASQPDKALRLFEEMKQKSGIKPDAKSYAAIIQACEVAGRKDLASTLSQEMKLNGMSLDS